MEQKNRYQCWVSTSYKVISFHVIEGYTEIDFRTREELIDHAMNLTANGFKVQ